MTKITVRTDGGKVRIKLRDEAKAPVAQAATGVEPLKPVEQVISGRRTLLLSKRLINLMEIRAESAFRPNQEDVELVYALSGSETNMPDMLHKLSSSTVVEEATQDYIVSSVQGMMEHITKERDNEPDLVVEVHTHPQSLSQPSEQDRRYFSSAAGTIRGLAPNTQVLFGIHAISSEVIRERQGPVKASRNTIRWSSITREHEIAFYTPDAQSCEVEIIE